MNRHSRTISVALVLLCGCRSPWAGLSRKAEVDKFPGLSRNRPDSSQSDAPLASAAASPQGRSMDALLSRADRELQRGDLDAAKNMYRQVLSVKADHPVAHHRLAIIADRQSDFDAANFHYEFARRSKGSDPDLLNDMGYSYYLQGNYKESERLLRQALSIRPTHRDAINNLAQVYAIQGKQADAESMLRLANSESDTDAATGRTTLNGTRPGTARIGANLLGSPLYAPELRPGSRTAALDRRELEQTSAQTRLDQAPTPAAKAPSARITDVEPTEPPAPAQSPVFNEPNGTEWNRISTASNVIAEQPTAWSYERAANKVDPLESMAVWPPAESHANVQPLLPQTRPNVPPVTYSSSTTSGEFGQPQRSAKPQLQTPPNTLPTTSPPEQQTRSFRDPW